MPPAISPAVVAVTGVHEALAFAPDLWTTRRHIAVGTPISGRSSRRDRRVSTVIFLVKVGLMLVQPVVAFVGPVSCERNRRAGKHHNRGHKHDERCLAVHAKSPEMMCLHCIKLTKYCSSQNKQSRGEPKRSSGRCKGRSFRSPPEEM